MYKQLCMQLIHILVAPVNPYMKQQSILLEVKVILDVRITEVEIFRQFSM